MLHRLANVVYWLCSAIAITIAVGGLFLGYQGGGLERNPEIVIFILAVALIVWLVGVAIRYVLVGRGVGVSRE